MKNYRLKKEERYCCEDCGDEWTTFNCPECEHGEGIHYFGEDDNPFCMDCEVEFDFIKKDEEFIYLKSKTI